MSLSLYYATKLELKMWTSLPPEQNQSLFNKAKYNACLVATSFIESLKHLSASVESFVKSFFSLAFKAGSFIGKVTGLNKLCSERVINNLSIAQAKVGSFKENLICVISNLVIAVVLIPVGCLDSYRHFNTCKVDVLIKGFQRELREIETKASKV